MRSRSTNILQAVVLFTGIVYFVVGIFFFFSPITILEWFAENVSHNWFDLARDNELIAPLYYMTQGFSALLMTSGMAMILPLFDPLKYRGLIYYNGLIFPFLASIVFMKNGIFRVFLRTHPGAEADASFMSLMKSQGGHLIVFIMGIIFTVIFFATLAGIIVTRKEARQGIE